MGVGLKFGDVYALLGTDNLMLDVRQRSLAHELLALLLRGFLHFVGLALFFGDLSLCLRLHQRGGWVNVADERVDGLHVVSPDGGANVLGGLDLALAAGAEKVEHGIILRRVAAVPAQPERTTGQVPRTAQQDLLLQAASSAAVEERLGILEIVVGGHDWASNFARFDRLPSSVVTMPT